MIRFLLADVFVLGSDGFFVLDDDEINSFCTRSSSVFVHVVVISLRTTIVSRRELELDIIVVDESDVEKSIRLLCCCGWRPDVDSNMVEFFS